MTVLVATARMARVTGIMTVLVIGIGTDTGIEATADTIGRDAFELPTAVRTGGPFKTASASHIAAIEIKASDGTERLGRYLNAAAAPLRPSSHSAPPQPRGFFFLRLSFRRVPLAGLNVPTTHAQGHGTLAARSCRPGNGSLRHRLIAVQAGWIYAMVMVHPTQAILRQFVILFKIAHIGVLIHRDLRNPFDAACRACRERSPLGFFL